MINFDGQYFQRIKFSSQQLGDHLTSAERDLYIAQDSDVSEVTFRFTYDALIKLGITLIAHKGFKVRSKPGHHIMILEKLSQLLDDEDIAVFGNKMRQKRNTDLYSGGSLASEKDSIEYLKFAESVFENARKILS